MTTLANLIHGATGADVITYPASSTALSYTGSDQNYVVGAGVNRIRFKMWGGGGCKIQGGGAGGNGGAGGFASGEIAVTPGETLTVKVAGGGNYNGSNTDVSGGAGSSGIFRSATPLAMAGGGAGNAYSGGYNGGEGGGSSGNAGGGPGAGGGTQSAGGALFGSYGTAGSSQQGGTGGDPGWTARVATGGYPDGGAGRSDAATASGQGGGGGYYGGGGASNSGSGAPGGGSGYIGGCVAGTGTTTAGSGSTPPETGDSDYSAGIGAGATSNNTDGGNGKVVIY